MTKSKLKDKLQHPVALAAQGFVFGVILFWSTAPGEAGPQVPVQNIPAAVATR